MKFEIGQVVHHRLFVICGVDPIVTRIFVWLPFLLLPVTPILAQDGGEDTLAVEDRWLAFDKVQHATFSFLWLLSVQYVAVNKFDLSEQKAFPLSLSTAAALGILKEVYDSRQPGGHFSRRDLVANGLGLCLGSAVVLSPGKK